MSNQRNTDRRRGNRRLLILRERRSGFDRRQRVAAAYQDASK
jgi:hypothetical protein